MISILINAYACAPHKGSEPGMGWNWITNIAKHCKVFVITEGEWEVEIETAIKELPQGKNMVFYYNPVPNQIREMCWNQGDWRFYYYYKIWQEKTLKIAWKIIKDQHIDIIHQLNMIGYREPGFLWKINNIPTVWGPVGGFTTIPSSFLSEFSLKNKLGWVIKNMLNQIQSYSSIRLHKAIRNFSVIIAATPIDEKRITSLSSNTKKVIQIPETGSYINDFDPTIKDFKRLKILFIGKLDDRKALPIALKTISKLKNKELIEFHILGNGKNLESYKNLASELNISNVCIWHGNIAKPDVEFFLQQSNLLFFPSIQDATSSVVLEALSYGVPVLCHNANGYGAIIDESCGFKIPFKSPNISIKYFGEILSELIEIPEKLKDLSKGAYLKSLEHTWDEHAKQMINIYNKILQK